MIEFDDACELIFENTNRLGIEKRLIENSIGYILAQDVVSPINVSPFRNSAMDGFAVKSEWLTECSADNPCVMLIGPTSFAGHGVSSDLPDRYPMKVMTGARVPEGFDAVVQFEDTDCDEHEVRFSASASPITE